MSELMGLSLLFMLLLVFEIVVHGREQRQMNTFYELSRRATAVEDVVKKQVPRNCHRRGRHHHRPGGTE